MEFIKALRSKTKFYNSPFKHWEVNEPLTSSAIKEICNTIPRGYDQSLR